MSKRWLIRLGFIVVFLAGVLASSGCSAVKQISEAAIKVRQDAAEIRTDAASITANADNIRIITDQKLTGDAKAAVGELLDDINASAARIDSKAIDIDTLAAYVQGKLPDVEDKARILTALKWIGGGILFLALIFVAWRLNLFLLGERFIQWIVNHVSKLIGA